MRTQFSVSHNFLSFLVASVKRKNDVAKSEYSKFHPLSNIDSQSIENTSDIVNKRAIRINNMIIKKFGTCLRFFKLERKDESNYRVGKKLAASSLLV